MPNVKALAQELIATAVKLAGPLEAYTNPQGEIRSIYELPINRVEFTIYTVFGAELNLTASSLDSGVPVMVSRHSLVQNREQIFEGLRVVICVTI